MLLLRDDSSVCVYRQFNSPLILPRLWPEGPDCQSKQRIIHQCNPDFNYTGKKDVLYLIFYRGWSQWKLLKVISHQKPLSNDTVIGNNTFRSIYAIIAIHLIHANFY